MQLYNYEITEIDNGLGAMIDLEIKGKLKFKIFENKMITEDAMEPIKASLQGATEEEASEILLETQDLTLKTFTYEELEPLEMSARQVANLRKIIETDDAEAV